MQWDTNTSYISEFGSHVGKHEEEIQNYCVINSIRRLLKVNHSYSGKQKKEKGSSLLQAAGSLEEKKEEVPKMPKGQEKENQGSFNGQSSQLEI